MKHLASILPVIFFLASYANAKSLLENCADNKLKEYKTKNLVTIAEEPVMLRKFRAECAKYTYTTPAEKQALAAEAQAVERQAKVDKEKTAAKPVAPSPVAPPTPPAPSVAVSSNSSQTVIGGCGTPAQCEAYMREANTPKYTWSSPGLQAYMGELWGNNFSYAHGLGGTFEQPENPCNESNQGQMIGLDLGTEVIAVSCMSSFATQEEIKKMAEKIKSIKPETLVPIVIAVKKPKYEWKIIKVAPPREKDTYCICSGPGFCGTHNLGVEFTDNPCCPVLKCIRIDGGPVKPKSEKKAEPAPSPTPAPTPPPETT